MLLKGIDEYFKYILKSVNIDYNWIRTLTSGYERGSFKPRFNQYLPMQLIHCMIKNK